MSGGTIYGYCFGDDFYCSGCLYDLFLPTGRAAHPNRSTEDLLDEIACENELDRADLGSYSTDDFPQAMSFGDTAESDRCVICQRGLIEIHATQD